MKTVKLLALLFLLPSALHADYLYIGEDNYNRIGKYSSDGTVINASLIPNLYAPRDIKFDNQGNLIVVCAGEGDISPSTIGLYTTSGAPLNTLLTAIYGVGDFYWGAALVGTNLVATVENTASVPSFDFEGTNFVSTNSQFISAYTKYSGPIVTDGSYYYINDSAFGYLQKYSLTGGVINQRLVSGLANGNTMAIDGTNLYVAYYSANAVAQYSTSGQILNTNLISAPSPWGIACDGHGHIYLGNHAVGSVSEYNTDGSLIRSNIITGLSGVFTLAVERTAPSLTITQATNTVYVTWPGGTNYMLQTNGDLSGTNWNADTNVIFANGTNTATITPAVNNLFFRLESTNGL